MLEQSFASDTRFRLTALHGLTLSAPPSPLAGTTAVSWRFSPPDAHDHPAAGDREDAGTRVVFRSVPDRMPESICGRLRLCGHIDMDTLLAPLSVRAALVGPGTTRRVIGESTTWLVAFQRRRMIEIDLGHVNGAIEPGSTIELTLWSAADRHEVERASRSFDTSPLPGRLTLTIGGPDGAALEILASHS